MSRSISDIIHQAVFVFPKMTRKDKEPQETDSINQPNIITKTSATLLITKSLICTCGKRKADSALNIFFVLILCQLHEDYIRDL